MAKSHLSTYVEDLKGQGKKDLAESVLATARQFSEDHLSRFSYASDEIGLLLGNIQSGKTSQVLAIVCMAADQGFPLFILLTSDNVVLQQQTLRRVARALPGFCICGENDGVLFEENNLQKPVVIVLKKNARMLKLWDNILTSTGFVRGNTLFVIDDEADAASLNTLVNRNGQSSINRHIESIRSQSCSSIYLQVTGTPQALFLQTAGSGWRPFFTQYFNPGESYLGGDFFFPPDSAPRCIHFIDEMKNPSKEVILNHLATSSIVFSRGGKVCNCMIHPSVRVNVHNKHANAIRGQISWFRENSRDEYEAAIRELVREKIKPGEDEESIVMHAISLLDDPLAISVIVMNGKNDVTSDLYESGCNFIIGGNSLGRGVTFPRLQTIYYTRTSKKPQVDTVWQHSRMFGYDRDPELMGVFIEKKLYKMFADINTANNSLIAQVEKGYDDVQIILPEGIKPTRDNVLNKHMIGSIVGGSNYYPFNPDNDSIEALSNLLSSFSEEESYYQVNLRLIKELLQHVIPSDDFDMKAILAILDSILAEKPIEQGVLIVRRGRNVTQGTGALLSANDWELGKRFANKVVLTMYQVTGERGWCGKPLWVPNIKFPEGMIYYQVATE